MQISNLHVSNRFDSNFIIDSFKKAKLFQPDFVVYTGDFVHNGFIKESINVNTVLQQAVYGKIETFGVLGNHDYGKNW